MAAGTAAETRLSLAQLLDPEVLANPYPLYHRLRAEDPVHWDPYLHAWIVTRYDDVVTVLTRFSADRTPTPEYFARLGAPEVSPIAEMMVKQMLFLDAPAHTRLRRLAAPAFMPARVSALREHIAEIATKLIDRVVARGTGRLDLLADVAAPLPAIVTAEMLGVPVEDHVQLKAWSATFAEMLGNFQHNPDRLGGVLQALDHLAAYFKDAILEQRKRPREGLVHALMASESAGDRLSDEEVVANCIVTMVGGQETTTNLIRHSSRAFVPTRRSCLRRSKNSCGTKARASTRLDSRRRTSSSAESRFANGRQSSPSWRPAIATRCASRIRIGSISIAPTIGISRSDGRRTSASARRSPASKRTSLSKRCCADSHDSSSPVNRSCGVRTSACAA
jgi:hypothetical protein